MSRSRSDDSARRIGSSSDPLRPADHADVRAATRTAADDIVQPALGLVGWLRWGWRQLTTMRTALVLLLLLAIAAVPGSIVPQRSADPNGVTQYFADNPDLAPDPRRPAAVRRLLVGVVLGDLHPAVRLADRLRHPAHEAPLEGAARAAAAHSGAAAPARRPPRVDRRADAGRGCRGSRRRPRSSLAEAQLKRAGYRVERYDTGAARCRSRRSADTCARRATSSSTRRSSACCIAVGVGGGLTYTGQSVIIEGRTFVNTMLDYASFNPGRFVDEDKLTPYSLTLDEFAVTYQPPGTPGAGQAGDFVAHLTTELAGRGRRRRATCASTTRSRSRATGSTSWATATRRRSRSETPTATSCSRSRCRSCRRTRNMTSLGVVKVPDGLPEQLGLVGFFYPTQAPLDRARSRRCIPALVYPVLTLNVYAGDLGIDDGTPRSVYTLDPTGMTQLTGGDTGVEPDRARARQTTDLPDGYGTITFENESRPPAVTRHARTTTDPVKRYVSLSVHRDVVAPWVLGVRGARARRPARGAVRAAPPHVGQGDHRGPARCRIEYAGLARGEDPDPRGRRRPGRAAARRRARGRAA